MEIILNLLHGIFMFFPSKNQRRFYKKYNKLKKQDWFQEYANRYGFMLMYNAEFKQFVLSQDIDQICTSKKQEDIFKDKLDSLLNKETIF